LLDKLRGHPSSEIFNFAEGKDAEGKDYLLLVKIDLDFKLKKYSDSNQICTDIRNMIQQHITKASQIGG